MPFTPDRPRREGRGMRRFAAAFVLAAGMAGAAQAALPGPDVYYGVGIEGFGDESALSFGSLTMSNDFGTATATVGTNPQPFVSLTLQSSDSSYGAHHTSAFGQLGYYVQAAGPAGAQVPVWLTASGSISYSDSNANLNGSLKIIRQYFTTPLVDEQLCHHSLFCGTNFKDSFSLSKTPLLFEAGALYYVSMVAQATVMTNGGGGNGHATVFLDPYFEIDPAFANAADYALQFSPGIEQMAPVPEPQTWALLLAGMGLGAAWAQRRRGDAGLPAEG